MMGFWNDRRGNVALLFAVCLVPILSAVGMAIDYTRAVNARTAMQTAADNAALMAMKDSVGLSPAEGPREPSPILKGFFSEKTSPVFSDGFIHARHRKRCIRAAKGQRQPHD